MGKEDQAEEIEILQSIYPEELELHDETALTVHLTLETDPPRQLDVDIEFPENYPEDSIPEISVEVSKLETDSTGNADGDDAATGEPKFTYDFTKTDCQLLTEKAKEVAEENIGIPSVFTVVSMIKENAEELYDDRIKEQEAERLRLLTLEEEKEQAKFKGTPVTKESFNAWRLKFRAEMGWDKPKERPFGRFTGKEIFDKGLYKEDEDDENEEASSNANNDTNKDAEAK